RAGIAAHLADIDRPIGPAGQRQDQPDLVDIAGIEIAVERQHASLSPKLMAQRVVTEPAVGVARSILTPACGKTHGIQKLRGVQAETSSQTSSPVLRKRCGRRLSK